jgi:hypothetical protein
MAGNNMLVQRIFDEWLKNKKNIISLFGMLDTNLTTINLATDQYIYM